MKTFKHIHLSTRYDRSLTSLQRVVVSYIEKKNASVITFTEVDSEKREKVLRKIEGWGFVAGDKTGRDDCAIIWDESEWTCLHKETHNVAKYMAGNIGAAFAVLERKDTGHAILVSVVHLPSAVEGHGRVSGGRADEWFTAVRNWKRKTNRLRKRFGVKRVMLVADWNLDLKKWWVKTLIKTNFPRYRWLWKKMPRVGTHGNRLIDFTLIRGRLRLEKEPRIHSITQASDHRGYEEVLAFTA